MRLALVQINPVVGDLDGNRQLILERLEAAKSQGADLVLFPELAVTGYPPEDLLLRRGFVRAAERTLAEIAAHATGIAAVVGFPRFEVDLFNAAAVCADGEVKAVYRKRFLPNYGVFDEDRYFAPGRELVLLELGDTLVGLTICEDMWQPGPPASELALAGAELLVNVSASPFHVGRERMREQMFRSRARDYVSMVAFCNLVGGQDELIFDGHSVVIDDEGEVLARAAGFEEELLVVVATGPVPEGHVPPQIAEFAEELESMRQALALGLRDYVTKNGFREIVVGVSGGIDSALTAALAVDALGAGAVHCVSMPSRYSSEATRADARKLAESLGAHFLELPIEAA